MTTTDFFHLFDQACVQVIVGDRYLLEHQINEKSISFKLGSYLQQTIKDYNVDCEYNGDVEKPNDIKALEMAERRIRELAHKINEENTYRINPDIIVHERGTNRNNFIVIEVKKDTSLERHKEFDLIKLEHLTIDFLGNHYNYHLGIAIEFGTGSNTGIKKEVYFQNGIPIYERSNLAPLEKRDDLKIN